MAKTIFIRGVPWFGRIWTEEFLQRRDNVVAAVRNTEILPQFAKEFPSNFLVLKAQAFGFRESTIKISIGQNSYPWVNRLNRI